jgi:chromosomal replication initiator protein
MKDFWENLLYLVRGRVAGGVFDAWIKPLLFVRLDGGSLVVEAPDSFFKHWLEEHYGSIIREAAKELVEKDVSLSIVVRSPSLKKSDTTQKKHFPPPPPRAPANISSRYTFENFIVGTGNQFSHAACLAVANNPAHSYNPLFIYGGVGLGKTHLLNAIGHHTLKNNPRTNVCYVTSEQFTNELINSIRYEKMTSFRTRFRNLGVLLLDDIQFVAGKERTQEEFFHTFNSLYESHHQIVITSDTFPKDMHFLEERLRSRFGWGLIADIQPPDLETMVAILKQKSRSYGVSLPNDVAFFLASKATSNIRELEGLLNRVVAYSSLNGCEITLGLAEDVLKNLIRADVGETNVSSIQKVVSSHFNIKISDLKSNRKHKKVVLPRQICMYLTRRLTKMSFPEIGSHFGGKDHSTIIYAVNKIKTQLNQDKNIKNTIDNIINKLYQ